MNEESGKPTGRAKGGAARAAALTPEERSAIARKGALARKERKNKEALGPHLPVAQYGSDERPLRILETEIPCYVLNDGTRVLTQQGFLSAIGRSATPKAGTGVQSIGSGVDDLPAFLAAWNLKPLITKQISDSTKPVKFRLPGGNIAHGFRAEALPQVCNIYLEAKDRGLLLGSQKHIADKAGILVRGLAETGIVALVDEATGYQEVRARDALQQYLERFIRKELAAWVKTFPDDFFRELYRLKRWPWNGSSRRPGVVGNYIKDLIYERLGPGVLAELERKNPTNEKGRRKAKHHQWLTDEIGNPALAQHMYALIGFMRAEDDWEAFKARFTRAYPKKGDTLPLI